MGRVTVSLMGRDFAKSVIDEYRKEQEYGANLYCDDDRPDEYLSKKQYEARIQACNELIKRLKLLD